VNHVVHGLFPEGYRVFISNYAFEFSLKNGLTLREISGAVEESVKAKVLNQHFESVAFKVAYNGFCLSYGGDKGSEESKFHWFSKILNK
jgi:hypothetical protein